MKRSQLARSESESTRSRIVTELFHRYGPMVRRRAKRLLRSDSDADEVVQDVFIRAMNHLEAFDGQDGTAWFYRATTNLCLNQIRNVKRRTELLEQHVLPVEQARTQANPDEYVTLKWLLQRADEREATCAVYVYVDGFGHDEAAQMIGVSPRTVRTLLRRFDQWARSALQGQQAVAQ